MSQLLVDYSKPLTVEVALPVDLLPAGRVNVIKEAKVEFGRLFVEKFCKTYELDNSYRFYYDLHYKNFQQEKLVTQIEKVLTNKELNSNAKLKLIQDLTDRMNKLLHGGINDQTKTAKNP